MIIGDYRVIYVIEGDAVSVLHVRTVSTTESYKNNLLKIGALSFGL